MQKEKLIKMAKRRRFCWYSGYPFCDIFIVREGFKQVGACQADEVTLRSIYYCFAIGSFYEMQACKLLFRTGNMQNCTTAFTLLKANALAALQLFTLHRSKFKKTKIPKRGAMGFLTN